MSFTIRGIYNVIIESYIW